MLGLACLFGVFGLGLRKCDRSGHTAADFEHATTETAA